jgi:hypothetical protein
MATMLFCDNYSTCNESMLRHPDGDHATEQQARAKGWHLYQGPSLTGKDLDYVLGPRCVGRAQRAKLPELQPGDQTMIQMEVEIGGAQDEAA